MGLLGWKEKWRKREEGADTNITRARSSEAAEDATFPLRKPTFGCPNTRGRKGERRGARLKAQEVEVVKLLMSRDVCKIP